MALPTRDKLESSKLRKAKTAFKNIYSKFERTIEKHERINNKYIFAKDVVKNFKLKIVLETYRLLGKSENFDQNLVTCPYGDGLLKKTNIITKNDIKNLYNDLSLKDSTDMNPSNTTNQHFKIANGRRIFSFTNDNESIALDGLAKKVVRNKGHQYGFKKRAPGNLANENEGSAAANYLLDILARHKKENTKSHEVGGISNIAELSANEEIDNEEDIIILTDDIVISSEDDVVYSEFEKDNSVDIIDESSEDDITALSDEELDEQDAEIVLSSDHDDSGSLDIEENVNESDGLSETSILKDEESFLINDIEKEESPAVHDSNDVIYEFPLGEHVGDYKKNDIIDASKYETYVIDYRF